MMSQITASLHEKQVRVLFLFGTNTLSSFADSEQMAEGLDRTDLVVSYDLFMNDTARRFADVILPGTAWLEELGCKATNTHLYLMEQALPPPGETRPLRQMRYGLAGHLQLEGFFPWDSQEGLILGGSSIWRAGQNGRIYDRSSLTPWCQLILTLCRTHASP